MDELAFLSTIQHTPTDDAPLLIYADWLEEQDEPLANTKAEFIRLTVAQAVSDDSKQAGSKREERLQELAVALKPMWLAIVSRVPVENCAGNRSEPQTHRLPRLRFSILCGRRWEELTATTDTTARFCDQCQQQVHYCDTITAARDHARQGHCVAVDLAIPRERDDLSPWPMLMGMADIDGVIVPTDADD